MTFHIGKWFLSGDVIVMVLEADEAMVGDGDAMGVAGKIVENVFGSTRRAAWHRRPSPRSRAV